MCSHTWTWKLPPTPPLPSLISPSPLCPSRSIHHPLSFTCESVKSSIHYFVLLLIKLKRLGRMPGLPFSDTFVFHPYRRKFPYFLYLLLLFSVVAVVLGCCSVLLLLLLLFVWLGDLLFLWVYLFIFYSITGSLKHEILQGERCQLKTRKLTNICDKTSIGAQYSTFLQTNWQLSSLEKPCHVDCLLIYLVVSS